MKHLILFLACLAPAFAQESGVSEPPLVIYGKIVHIDSGSTYQLSSGTLSLTIADPNNRDNTITTTTELSPSGNSGEFSYRLAIPQRNLPAPSELSSTLSVGDDATSYLLSATSIDGVPAEAVDPTQLQIETSFASRANEHRLDLLVNLPQIDTDGDGMPDWWEELYGLNPRSASDADDDEDGDNLTNLEEFQNASRPDVSNADPTFALLTQTIPSGGNAGFYIRITDSDSTPSQLSFSPLLASSSITFNRTTFTYADVLAGGVFMTAEPDFNATNVSFRVTDAVSSNVFNVDIPIQPYHPGLLGNLPPAVWLNSDDLVENQVVSEWPDRSPNGRPGYQPTSAQQPTGSALTSAEFLYLDDRQLDLSELTAFISFRSNTLNTTDQVLLNAANTRISIGGSDIPRHAQTLRVQHGSQQVNGPPVTLNQITQLTFGNDSLTVNGTSFHRSTSVETPLPSAFPTIAAQRGLFESAASQFLNGNIQEILLYDLALDPAIRSRNEDYQLSRWSDVVVWDLRNETTPLSLSGTSARRNIINGGWADDQLAGSTLNDILRGGPGIDTFTGNTGADRFQIFPDQGNDLITDFSEVQKDVLDLTAIFGQRFGTPGQYLNIRTEVVRVNGSAPIVNSILELNYDGTGDDVDQTITFQGIPLSNDDLPRLVGSGRISLGGPQYETGLDLTPAETQLVETTTPRTLTLTRNGNLDAAIEIALSFVGEATPDVDYTITGVSGTGAIRTVSFAEGEAKKTISIVPIQDTLVESETITIATLPTSALTSSPEQDTALGLDDAPQISIESLVSHAQRLGSVPGVIQVSRGGNLTEPMDVKISFDGSAINGEDFVQVNPTISFDIGEQTKMIQVTPASHALDKGQPKVTTVSVVPDTTKYAALSPWSASVMILDKLNGEAKDYDSFRAELPSPFNLEGALANPDGDGISLYREYVHGLDPTAADDPTAPDVKPFILDGRFVMEVPTRAGLSDVRLFPAAFTTGFPDVSDQFEHSLYSLSDDRVMHVFTSRQSVTEVDRAQIFVLRSMPVPVSTLESSPSSLLGTTDQTYLITGSQSGWIPASNAAGLAAAPREAGVSSAFKTVVTGTGPISFDWEVPAGSGATMTFSINGTIIATLTDGEAATTENHTLTNSGDHQLKWTITYGNATNETLSHHGFIHSVSL